MTQVVITSDAQSIRVRVQFDDLTRRAMMSELDVHLRTNTGTRRLTRLFLGQMSNQEWRGDTDIMRPSSVAVDCDVTHAVDFRDNNIRLDIARDCLGEPRWVQARVVSFFGDNQARIYVDKSRTDFADANVWTRQIGHG